MSTIPNNHPQTGWKKYEQIVFRVAFIYFIIQVIPIDWKFYEQLFSVNWARVYYGDIFNMAHYTPQFVAGGQSFANWGIAFLIALAGAAAWTTYFDRNKNKEYNTLYYWLRVILRYRLAIAVMAYGFIKFFPLQAPYPSISNLNTNYGDFNRWKLFSLSLGIVPSYEAFLGAVEILLGLLLLYRKTASIAAFIIIVFAGNVFMSNIAYDGGEIVYSFFLISLAFFILWFDLQRIISLLILQKPTAPNYFKPSFLLPWQKNGRLILKGLFILFFAGIYGFKTSPASQDGSYQYPKTKGLPGISGIYNVAGFVVNKDSIGYSKTDPKRWQDVVFEKWNTISIRSNRPVIIDSTNVDRIYTDDENRRYELEGSAGRHYYSYDADTVNHVLTLHNRNKNYKDETLLLHYNRQNDSTIILSGINQDRDSIFTVLNRINRKYLLEVVARQGRGKALKL